MKLSMETYVLLKKKHHCFIDHFVCVSRKTILYYMQVVYSKISY